MDTTEAATGSHVVKVTRSVNGQYGWTLEIGDDGATADDVRASIEALRKVDAEMRQDLPEVSR